MEIESGDETFREEAHLLEQITYPDERRRADRPRNRPTRASWKLSTGKFERSASTKTGSCY
jgi:hypothetical protein